nr:NAD(P)H-dependent oxidoreductase [Bartonella sp. DB5-6]
MSHYNRCAKVHAFVKTHAAADGAILSNPVYHEFYSGILKNALDNLDYDAFGDKAVGSLSLSWQYSQKMRYCHVILDQLCIRFMDRHCNVRLLQLKMILRLRMKTVHGDLAAKMYGLAAHNLADEMYYRFLNNKGGEYDQK